MSKQDVGFFDVGAACPDMVIENGDLKADESLETASLISLFSDKRITLEELPPGEEDQKGWWGDQISTPEGDRIGSKLWTLARKGKVTDITVVEMEAILTDAFNWMLEDGIAATVVVDAEKNGLNEIRGSVKIFKPNGDNIPLKFIWDGQGLKLLED